MNCLSEVILFGFISMSGNGIAHFECLYKWAFGWNSLKALVLLVLMSDHL